jgi:hypothetical protein
METPINAGSFQEYDYNNEDAECEWKQNDKNSICSMPVCEWAIGGTQDSGQFIYLFEDEA